MNGHATDMFFINYRYCVNEQEMIPLHPKTTNRFLRCTEIFYFVAF